MIEKSNHTIKSFSDLAEWRKKHINNTVATYEELNDLHDELVTSIVQLSIQQLETEQGKIPARFSFFVMGSTGRREQALWSDQDHAIVHEGTAENDDYFLALGARIVEGMAQCGYERCDGKVMAEERRWCKSAAAMKQQLEGWLQTAEWEDIRHTLILFDSRTLYGPEENNSELKEIMFNYSRFRESIRLKVVENTKFRQRRRNVFGQILADKHGYFDFKTGVLFPYVNAVRIAAMLEGIHASETRDRMKKLVKAIPGIQYYEESFSAALQFRHEKTKQVDSYEFVHHIKLAELSSGEEKLVKQWMKDGKELLDTVQKYYSRKERKS